MKGIILSVFLLLRIWPGPVPPPPGPPRDFADRFSDLRRKLDSQHAVDVSAQRAFQYSRQYLARAQKAYRSEHREQAERLLAAADALARVADHQQHLRAGAGPPAPPPEAIKDHLQRVYFRTEQTDYFLQQAHDPVATALPGWARGFYQLAVRDFDRKQWLAADENAKCAEDVTDALEDLAQAASITQ